MFDPDFFSEVALFPTCSHISEMLKHAAIKKKAIAGRLKVWRVSRNILPVWTAVTKEPSGHVKSGILDKMLRRRVVPMALSLNFLCFTSEMMRYRPIMKLHSEMSIAELPKTILWRSERERTGTDRSQ